ncbi:MAG: alkaline phosphatase family protein [Myxococcaceae bacterium]|nr:alkaline phosphatase family protein [Myxococcaceae bacterium]
MIDVGMIVRSTRLSPLVKLTAAASLLAWLAGCAHKPDSQRTHVATARRPVQHVVLVTIDGLLPDSYLHADAHGLRVPTLRRFMREGAFSDGALSAFPTLTYPAHASIATGVWPARHGVTSNRRFDPLDQTQEAWLWYAEELRQKPIWQVAEEAGLTTALIEWPTTVGAKATWLMPEYWRTRTPEDLKLVRALSTPGLLERVAERFPGYEGRAAPPHVTDQAGVDVAVQTLAEGKPALLMLHIFQVDEAQHKHGLWSPEAQAAIENADQQLERLIAAVQQAGIGSATAFVVASDHGFINVERQINPGAWLREAGLIELDEKGKTKRWQAAILPNGGSAYLYVDGSVAGVEQQLSALIESKRKVSNSGIVQVLSRAQIAEKGGDPEAVLALEAELGTTFGPNLQSYEGTPPSRATHGYDPARAEMKASLLLLGPSVQPGLLKDARLVDIAPTVAKWLSLSLPNVDGQPLQ